MKTENSNREILNTWSELQLLTGLIFGEGRGECWLGKVAIGIVVRNRVNRPGFWNWGSNWREVILAPKQFSCFNDNDPNLDRIIRTRRQCKHDMIWQECWSVAELVYLDRVVDRLNGATHYCSVDITPSWADKLKYLGTIGKHNFYGIPHDGSA